MTLHALPFLFNQQYHWKRKEAYRTTGSSLQLQHGKFSSVIRNERSGRLPSHSLLSLTRLARGHALGQFKHQFEFSSVSAAVKMLDNAASNTACCSGVVQFHLLSKKSKITTPSED
jgi:hypothetical protein